MKRFLMLLTPSSTSGLVAILGALIIACFNGWSYIQYRQFYYDFLFGVNGLKTALLQDRDRLAFLRHTLLGSGNSTYYILLILAGILAAVMTYVIISAVIRARNATHDVLVEMHHGGKAFWHSVDQSFLRLAVRVCALVGWTLYIIFWFNLLMPYASLILENGIDNIAAGGATGWLTIGLSCLLIAVSLHLHLVFLRLCLLRPRLLGGYPVG